MGYSSAYLYKSLSLDTFARIDAQAIDIDFASPFTMHSASMSIGKKRGMLISGGEINTERAAIMLLDEFRSGKLGRITLEMPER